MYPQGVQNGWVYYGTIDSIYRSDGNKTEKLVTKKDIGKNGFTIYRNYLILFDNQHMCFTMDLESLQVTQLFEIPGAANPSVMEDSIFCGAYYQITFSDDTAQLWELSWIKEEVDKELPEVDETDD